MTTLYISDLDGTLLHENARISDWSHARLCELIEQGMLFTVATARSLVSLREVIRDLPLRLPVIENNGACITDYATGRRLFTQAIPQSATRDAMDLMLKGNHAPFVSIFDGDIARMYYEGSRNAAMDWYIRERSAARDSRLTQTTDLRAASNRPVISMTLMGHAEPLGELRTALHDRLDGDIVTHFYENRYDPGHWWLSLHPAAATKGTAARRLIDQMDRPIDELVVFGDHENDMAMFEVADRAYAVANAVPALKAIATGVIGPNEADCVVRHIEREWRAG